MATSSGHSRVICKRQNLGVAGIDWPPVALSFPSPQLIAIKELYLMCSFDVKTIFSDTLCPIFAFCCFYAHLSPVSCAVNSRRSEPGDLAVARLTAESAVLNL